jgi:thaumarchaeosortase
MERVVQVIKKHSRLLMKLLPLIAFAVPLLLLYVLNPADPYMKLSAQDSFGGMWKGRTFELFFIWLIALELILSAEALQKNQVHKLVSARTFVFAAVLVLPTIYVIACNYWGLNGAIAGWAAQSGVPFADSMPLAIEYLVFTALFTAMVFLSFGFKGLKVFSLPAFFVALVGVLYTIDNVFPYGQFTPFQIFVPTTTSYASAILNLMGYTTSITYGSFEPNIPYLTATSLQNPQQTATFGIAWPCAGIESFLIFTVVALLFLKRMHLSWKAKIGYFVFGAAVTYTINALRIVEIFLTGMAYGESSLQVDLLHFYYAPLIAIGWIVSYPLIILASQSIWRRIRKPKLKQSQPA